MLPRRLAHALHRRRSPLSWLMVLALAILVLEPAVRLRRRFSVAVPPAELDAPFRTACQEPDVDAPRERAALVMLARNSDLAEARSSIERVEQRFNRWFHYPIVFFNNGPWSDEFEQAMREVVSGEARFEVLPNETWGFPDGIDVDAARESMQSQERSGLRYGGNENYHHMCRFFSGEFYLLPALAEFKYYWRIEPDVDFYCDLTYDPFVEMARNNKVYGWTTALWEIPETVPSLFRVTADYMASEGIAESPFWRTMLAPEWTPWPVRWWRSWTADQRDARGDKWSMCHFWSNFEIADLDWFRGGAYQKYYRHLLAQGGFYHERWGDAAVHSLAMAMLLEPSRMHHFSDIGYRHDNLWVCPANAPGGQLPDSKALGREGTGLKDKWDTEGEGGIGCRCSCPHGPGRRRNTQTYCTVKMNKPNTRARTWFGEGA